MKELPTLEMTIDLETGKKVESSVPFTEEYWTPVDLIEMSKHIKKPAKPKTKKPKYPK